MTEENQSLAWETQATRKKEETKRKQKQVVQECNFNEFTEIKILRFTRENILFKISST